MRKNLIVKNSVGRQELILNGCRVDLKVHAVIDQQISWQLVRAGSLKSVGVFQQFRNIFNRRASGQTVAFGKEIITQHIIKLHTSKKLKKRAPRHIEVQPFTNNGLLKPAEVVSSNSTFKVMSQVIASFDYYLIRRVKRSIDVVRIKRKMELVPNYSALTNVQSVATALADSIKKSF